MKKKSDDANHKQNDKNEEKKARDKSDENTFGLVFSVPTEHKRGPRTFHIQIWAYPSPHPHQNYYYRYRCHKF